MITSTHVVTNALLARRWWRSEDHESFGSIKKALTKRPAWFIGGGLAPDVGLTLLTAGAALYFPRRRGMSLNDTMEYAFGKLFWEDKAWITVQNTLHSPVVLLAMYGAGRRLGSDRMQAFSLGCLLHTTMDIPVHHNDGPLVFFPLDWKTRINSPVSYYDRDHHGGIVSRIDIAFTVLGGLSLLKSWVDSRR